VKEEALHEKGGKGGKRGAFTTQLENNFFPSRVHFIIINKQQKIFVK
jgi:hypothetical protein